MARVDDIITRARETLADPTGKRWSDARLLNLVKEAQEDICIQAELLRGSVTILSYINKQLYTLPDEVLLLDRVLYNGEPLTLTTHEKLDQADPDWEEAIGDIEAVVYDKLNRREIKVYPVPNTVTATDDYIFSSDYGIMTSLTDHTAVADYGIVTDLPSGVDSDYGVVVSGQVSVAGEMKLYYIKKPTAPVLGGDLHIDDMFDKAIKFYVTGMAFMDNKDTQSLTASEKELGFYDRDLNKLIDNRTTNNTRNSNRRSTYNPLG